MSILLLYGRKLWDKSRGSNMRPTIVAVAKNYAKHKVEMGGTPAKLERPCFFLKPSSSIVRAPFPIVKPARVRELHHEVELGVVISRRCSRAAASEWRSFVRGYVLALDMTARDLQADAKKMGMPWAAAKGFDTFTPLSEELPAALVPDPHALELWLRVDGVERQRGSTGDMLARIGELIEEVTGVMTLEAGDVILTGTPEGVGPVDVGQRIAAGITGLVSFEFDVVAQ